MWHMGGNIFGMHWVWWALGLVLIVWLFFANRKTLPDVGEKKDDPMDILNKKYAAGEISKEEYQEKKHILEESR